MSKKEMNLYKRCKNIFKSHGVDIGGGEGLQYDFVVVVYNANMAGTELRADKTYDEISTAINSGRNVVVHKKKSKNAANYSVYRYTKNTSGTYSFCNVYYAANTYSLIWIDMYETNGELSIEVAPTLDLPIATSP